MQRYITMYVVSEDMPLITVGISTMAESKDGAEMKADRIYDKTFPGIARLDTFTRLQHDKP